MCPKIASYSHSLSRVWYCGAKSWSRVKSVRCTLSYLQCRSGSLPALRRWNNSRSHSLHRKFLEKHPDWCWCMGGPLPLIRQSYNTICSDGSEPNAPRSTDSCQKHRWNEIMGSMDGCLWVFGWGLAHRCEKYHYYSFITKANRGR